MHDLVIRGGTIVDGSGNPRFTGDIAVDGGRITAVGAVAAPGREEIEAKGLIVTPGFVDITPIMMARRPGIRKWRRRRGTGSQQW